MRLALYIAQHVGPIPRGRARLDLLLLLRPQGQH